MQPLTKRLLLFLLFFVLSYLFLYFLVNTESINRLNASFLETTALSTVQTLLPKAKYEHRVDFTETRTILVLGFVNKEKLQEMIAEAKAKGAKTLDFDVEEVRYYVDYFVLPLIFLFSLIIATPISIKQKLLALLWGFLLFTAYYVFKIFLFMLMHISTNNIGIYDFGEGFESALKSLTRVMELNFSMLMAVLIWLLVALSKSNWKEIILQLRSPQTEQVKSKKQN